jgi:hypothetical protein
VTAFAVQQAVPLSEIPDTICAGISDLIEAGLQPEEAADGERKGTGTPGIRGPGGG